MESDLKLVVSGMVFAGYLVILLCFARFWVKTRDRLFLWFTAAFAVLAIERVLLIWLRVAHEPRPEIYLVRLCAFALIAIAILDKNRVK